MDVRFLRQLVVFCSLFALGCKNGQVARTPAASPPATRPAATTQTAQLQRFEFLPKLHMGVWVRMVVYARDEEHAIRAIRAAYDRIAKIDDAASDYRKNSELSKLLLGAHEKPVKVSEDLWTLFAEAQRLSKESGGVFDITVGPYVQLWRTARKDKKLPDPAAIAAAGKLVGWQKVTLDESTRSVKLATPGMKIDFGGIAKGYAGDCAIAALREHGIHSALVEAGGDIVVSDPPPGTDGWKVELMDARGAMPKVVTLKNAAVSTSGDTEQFVEIDGKHYSHVVDPRTGVGLTARAMGTVIAPKGIWADGLSKAVYMVDPAKREELLKAYPGSKAWVRVVD